MPRLVPSLDVFPFEETRENLCLRGHARSGEVNFGLREDPVAAGSKSKAPKTAISA
jgi:hypothetical protein